MVCTKSFSDQFEMKNFMNRMNIRKKNVIKIVHNPISTLSCWVLIWED